METSIFHRLSSILWVIIISLTVLLAVYVSVGRLLLSNLGLYQSTILEELNHRLPFVIEADQVRGDWQSFTPILVLSGLRLNVPGADEAIELSEGRIGVDVFGSLFSRTLRMTRVNLSGLTLRAELNESGQFRINGFDGGGGPLAERLRTFLLSIERIALKDNLLLVDLPGGDTRSLDLDLDLGRDGSRRRVTGMLVSNRGTRISVVAEGVGDPFEPALFDGELYLAIDSSDLGAMAELLPGGEPAVWADGSIALELWLTRSAGKSGVTGKLLAGDLLVSDAEGSWEVPLEHVALEASLVERKNRWTLYGSRLEFGQGGMISQVPRLQLDIWGEALRLRTAEVALAPLNAMLVSLENLPPALVDVFGILQPRGKLTALQLSVGDVANAASDWEVEANFEDLAVESWRGAPGVTAASGYVALAPGGGFVVLDNQDFTMDFPTVYSHPLAFEDFHGTIDLRWDQEVLDLSSGLITARGPEGVAKALFGLTIPLKPSEVGLEMDLLVGLADVDPVYRDKYLPYILNDSLLGWLDTSIGDGRIEQGAFLWRGSLRRGAAPLRTVQLFFNVAETDLKFDPAWPPLAGVDSIVLIDDTNVSVWAEQARMYGLSAASMSAEAWMGDAGTMVLAVEGQVRGPARDGLVLLNESPIGTLLGGGFDEWTLDGELETELSLRLNLAAGARAPVVDVKTRWHGVDVGVHPGNLLLTGVDGQLRYSSSEGLFSPGLTGRLWGRPLVATIAQRPKTPGASTYQPSRSVVEVNVAGQVAMSDVQEWLALESLAFATGLAAVEAQIDIAPGEAPVLYLDSTLAGIDLDFPSPWTKTAEEGTQLHIELPLAGADSVMSMDLDGQVALDLQIGGGELRAAALGFHEPPGVLSAGKIAIAGRVSYLDVEQWLEFVDQYFAAALQAVAPEPEPLSEELGPRALLGSVTDVAAPPLDPAVPLQPGLDTDAGGIQLQVAGLEVERLMLYGREIPRVEADLSIQKSRWDIAARTDWLRGRYSMSPGSLSSLDIDFLDISGIPPAAAEPAKATDQGGEDAILDLPPTVVTVHELVQGERRLGKLQMQVQSRDGELQASSIVGEVAAMQLSPEKPGQLSWLQGEGGRTQISANFQFDDLGETLRRFGYQQIVETRKGELELALQWPGSPQDFTLAGGQGSLQVELGRGSFLEAPGGASGALKVVSILNLADIVSRLSLSHMFESGIPFDAVSGEVHLHEGSIEVSRMEVQGGSSFNFSGVADVEERSLDGELVATLPVANNLPWVAALAGGLPVAAGVFVVSKVFEEQFDRLSSAVYAISGSWNEPEVNFARIFDTSSVRSGTGPATLPEGESGGDSEFSPVLPGTPLDVPGSGETGESQSDSP